MIEKTTLNRNYPKPDLNNSLQDDVVNIENAMDMIDTDIHSIKQEIEKKIRLESYIEFSIYTH
jgi:hypothetical protein